jgi:prevent-host-death family protein
MQAVGLRELKAKLSEYVRRARDGEVVLVTDRGEVVAELRSPSARHVQELGPLERLAARGLVRIGLPNDPSVYELPAQRCPPGTAARLLDEERGER